MRTAKYTENFPLTLTRWQREQLTKAAQERDMSCAKLVRVALGKYLSEPSSAAQR